MMVEATVIDTSDMAAMEFEGKDEERWMREKVRAR